MNVIQTETLKRWGGQQNKVILESLALRNLGHHVVLVCNPDAEIGGVARSLGFDVVAVEMNKRNWHRTLPAFLKIIKERDIDLLITHGSTDSWIGGVAAKLSRARPASLRERHNLFPIRSRPSRWLHHTLFDGILSISGAVTDYLREIGVASERIHDLPDAVDTTKFHPDLASTLRQEYDIPDDARVVGTLTSLRPKKGAWDYIDAAAIITQQPNTWVLLAGTNYPEIVNEAGHRLESIGGDRSRVIWTGRREDPANVLNAFDVFLCASHSEGLGTVLLEAMACKRPIVTYDIRPMNDLIENGQNGVTVRFRDSTALATAAIELLEDRDTAAKLADNAYRKASQAFDTDALQHRLAAIVSKIATTAETSR